MAALAREPEPVLLARTCGAAWPVLIMSGYGEELLGSQRMIPEGALFLQKPFTEQTLLARVQAIDVARSTPSKGAPDAT